MQLVTENVDASEYKIYSTSLSRAEKIAKLILEELGTEYVISKEIKELNNGIANNMYEKEAQKIRKPYQAPFHKYRKYEGGENYKELYNRISKFMNSVKDYKIIIVTHKDLAIIIAHWWLSHSMEQIEETTFVIDQCSISVFDISP